LADDDAAPPKPRKPPPPPAATRKPPPPPIPKSGAEIADAAKAQTDAKAQFKPPAPAVPKRPSDRMTIQGRPSARTPLPPPDGGKPKAAFDPRRAEPLKASPVAASKAPLPTPTRGAAPRPAPAPPPRSKPIDPARGNVVPPVAGEVRVLGDDADSDSFTIAFPGGEKPAVLEPVRHAQRGVLEAYVEEAKAAIAFFHHELHGETDPKRIGRFHYEIARLYETVVGDLEAADGHYTLALQSTPETLPVVVGARRVLIARGEYERALELFDRELRVTADRAAKAALMLQQARVLGDRLGRTADARKVLAAACELASSDAIAIKALAQADWSLQSWEQLAQTLEREANAVAGDPHHRAALIVHRARLTEVHRNDTEAAAELFEEAYQIDDKVAGALRALERLHHDRRHWRDLIRVLEIEAERTRDVDTRVMARFRIGQLQADRLGNRKEGIAALESAVQDNATQPAVLAALAQLYEEAGSHQALASTLSRLVSSTTDSSERLSHLQRIGELCRDELADENAAIRAYEAALSIDATYVPALRALAPLYAARKKFDLLVEMHEAEAAATNDIPRRALAHARAAEILERVDRRVEAIAHHERALTLDEELSSSFRALVRLYTLTGEHHKLIELYDRALQRVDRARQIEYLFAIGDLHRGPLGDAEAAEAAYARVLELDPKHLGAVHAIQRTAEAAGRWKQLVDAFDLEVSIVDDRSEIVALLHRVGQVLHELLGQPKEAVARFRRVLEIDSHHRATLASLGRIYATEGHWADLVDIYRRELDIIGDPQSKVALLHKTGEVYQRFLTDTDKAVACYRDALTLDPRHGPSAHALERIYAERNDWKALVTLVEAERQHATEPATKQRAAMRAGAIYEERLDDKNSAERCYADAVALQPGDQAAAEALARVRAQLQHWQALAEELEGRAQQAREPSASIDLLLRAAEVWLDRMGSAERAAGCYEQILEIDPSHLAALVALEPLFRRVKAWSSLSDVLSRQVDVLADPGAKAAALSERARVLELHGIGDADDLIDCYSQILSIRPGDRTALEGLERLALTAHDPRILADVEGRLAMAAGEPELASSYLTRQAEALETSGQPQALDVYRKALELDGKNRGALRGLNRLAELLGNGRAMVEAAEREAALARDPNEAANAWVRSGAVQADHLDDADAAIGAFEQALALWPDHVEAAERLRDLLGRRGEFETLVERLTRAATDAKTDARQSALWIEVSRLHAGELANLGAAVAALQRLLQKQPDNADALLELSQLFVGDRRHADALPLLERAIKAAPPVELRRRAHAMAAECYEAAGNAKMAFRNFERALEMGADDRDLLERMVALQMKEKQFAAAADVATKLVQIARSDNERVRGLMLLADAKAGAGATEDAVELLAEAISIEGLGGRARTRLARVADSPAAWSRYANALRDRLERRGGAGLEPAAVYLEIAKVEHERLEDADMSLGTLIEGLHACGSDPVLRFELARRLREVGRIDDSIEQFQYLLMDRVTHADAWRALAQGFGDTGRARERQMALQAVVVLEGPGAEEAMEIGGWQPRTAAIPPRALVPGALGELFVARERQEPAAAVLASLVDGLGKVRPVDLARWGVTRRDALPRGVEHPLRPLIDRLAALFGFDEFDCWLHHTQDTGVIVEPTPRPTLLVPAWLTELDLPRQVFPLARALFNLARGVHAIDGFSGREIEMLLAASARTIVPNYAEGVAAREILDDRQKLILKGLPRRRRDQYKSACTVLARSPTQDLGSFVQWAHQTARRVALIVADDLIGSLDALRRTDEIGDGPSSPIIADLLKVWVSKPAIDVRRRVGLV
jgi:tetratricopeptide (TPR) repeat protein